MKLSVYLFQPGLTMEKGVRQKYLEGADAYKETRPIQDLGFLCKAFIRPNKPKAPSWEPWLSQAFDTAQFDLKNQSNSFVLLLEAEGRVFAVTFGYGFTAIDRSRVEPDFGLKVTLNEADPSKLDMLDTRTIDLTTKQARTHLNVGSHISEFGVNTDLDWIRAVSGRALPGGIASRLHGSDGLKMTWKGSVRNLAQKCSELLRAYGKDTYKKNFSFIDQMRIVGQHEAVVRELDAKLKSALQAREKAKLAIALPEIPSDEVAVFKISQGRDKRQCIELDLSEVYAFLDENPDVEPEPDMIKVVGLNHENEARTSRSRLRLYLVAEVDHLGETYMHSLGRWFRVDREYLDEVKRKLSDLEDVTSLLSLPPRGYGEREGTYNDRIAVQRDWLGLDRRMFEFGKATNKIEACDLVTPELDLLCVKDMKSSATLSHLFAQGSVSGRLLKAEPGYRARFVEKLREKWPSLELDDGKVRIVYAISTGKPGPLAESLFFFSQVNLLQHVDAIRMAGYKVALCRIEKEQRV